ncbi:MAG: glycosyltransferase family 39 protein [Chitinophagaceae bacterium]
MSLNAKSSKTLPFYLFVIGAFLILISPEILSEGMFIDGLFYSTISNNLAHGIGTFWNRQFTATTFTQFNEHPPLAFGLQSLFITLFGDSSYVDKIYSITTYVITGCILLNIWKTLGYRHGWLPLLCWFSIPLVSWACKNNVLENTMMIFTTLSVLFYLKSLKSNRFFYVLLSGLMLALGFLTKGFVAFFPWTFPFFWWLLSRQKSFREMLTDSIGIFLFTVLPLVTLIILSPEARLSLNKYINNQVLYSLKNIVAVNSRFFIVKKLFMELIPVIGLSLLFIGAGWRKKFPFTTLKSYYKKAGVFILLGLAGVLPVMISMKQSGIYILTAFPFFAIGAAILLYPLAAFFLDTINYRSKKFLLFKFTGYGLFFIGLLLCLYFANHIGRDKNKIQDTHLILSKISYGSTVNVVPDLWWDWSLQGYFARFKNVSLDSNLANKRAYLIIKNENLPDSILKNYTKIELQTTEYKLYQTRSR